jgi:nicotinamidase-related amidase
MDISLDAKTTALVLIDLQKGIAAREFAPHATDVVLRNSARLAEAVRKYGGRAIYVNVIAMDVPRPPADVAFPGGNAAPSPDAAEIVPEAGMKSGDILVTKRSWGAFYGTDLDLHLRRRGMRTIILCGIATNFGVESTARAAYDHGYELIFAEDAMSSMTAEAHEWPVKAIFPRMGRVRSTEEIVKALA